MDKGWIKLHRQMRKWEWYHDTNCVRVWAHLLLTVNQAPSRFEGHDVPPGSRVTGYPQLAQECGLSVQQIRTVFSKLKSTNEITVNSQSKFSIVSITKWDEFQGDNRQATGKNITCNGEVEKNQQAYQQADYEQNLFSDQHVGDADKGEATGTPTGLQQASNRQATTSKEEEKIRREEEGACAAHDSPTSSKPKKTRTKKSAFNHINKPDDVPQQLWDDFVSLRELKRANVSQTAWDRICQAGARAQLTPEQTITLMCERGWQGFNADWIKPEDRQALSSKQDKPKDEQITLKNGRQVSRPFAVKRCAEYFRRKAAGEMSGRLWERIARFDDEYPPDHRESVYPDEVVQEAKSIARS